MALELGELSYRERLEALNLPTLEEKGGDLITTDDVDSEQSLERSKDERTKCNLKLNKKHRKCEVIYLQDL